MSSGYCVTMTTVADDAAAAALARALVERGLAACVQVVGARSTYRWEGAVEESAELLLLVKSTEARRAEVEEFIAANHAYDVPEVLTVPVTGGSARYLAWVDESTQPAG